MRSWVLGVICAAYLSFYFVDRHDYRFLLENKRVVVCGASTGIGEQLAYTYARYGARLLLAARNESRLRLVAEKCSKWGASSADYISVDLKNRNNELIDEAVDVMGGIDVIVLNHAFIPYTVWNFSSENNLKETEEVFRVNTLSYIHLTHKAMSYLEKSNGSIIVVSSFSGKFGVPYYTAYSASKHALHGYFDSLRQEMIVARSNVSITMVVLGLVKTQTLLNQLANKTGSMTGWLEPDSTAEIIAKAGARKEQEIYYPHISFSLISYAKAMFPRLFYYSLRSSLDPPSHDD